MELKLTRAELEILLQTRHPTDEEMSLINQFKPYGLDPWESSELMRFALIASNNLIHGSGQVWDKNVLETMVASYPGCALMLDHEWEDQTKTFGMIYDSFIYSLPRVSKEGIVRLFQKFPMAEKPMFQWGEFFMASRFVLSAIFLTVILNVPTTPHIWQG
jgi:hypothetical protein